MKRILAVLVISLGVGTFSASSHAALNEDSVETSGYNWLNCYLGINPNSVPSSNNIVTCDWGNGQPFNGTATGMITSLNVYNVVRIQQRTVALPNDLCAKMQASPYTIYCWHLTRNNAQINFASFGAQTDTDGDVFIDTIDNCPSLSNDQLNTDGDAQGDVCDTDDDNDGVLDVSDNCPLISASQLNTDGDSQGNACDTDDDNDGVTDAYDKFPLNIAAWSDADNDGFPGGWNAACDVTCQTNSGLTLDNCPTTSNANQLNTDGDAQGDACDTDDDNDGVADTSDKFPLDPTEWFDTDNDGIGNNTDTDDDGDGFVDVGGEILYSTSFDTVGAEWSLGTWGRTNASGFNGFTPPYYVTQMCSSFCNSTFTLKLTFTVSTPAKISFLTAFPSGSNNDLSYPFYIDNVSVGGFWVNRAAATSSFPVSAGVHVFNWSLNPESVNNRVLIDDVKIISSTDNCPLIVNADQLNADGDTQGDACDTDDDNDGMPDTWEILYGFNPLIHDANGDADNDGITNLQEYLNGSNPTTVVTVKNDYNNDGIAGWYWKGDAGDVATKNEIWQLTFPLQSSGWGAPTRLYPPNFVDQPNWEIVTTGDFNKDGDADVLWRNTSTAQWRVWQMQNGTRNAQNDLADFDLAHAWQVIGAGDTDKDGDDDIILNSVSTGYVMIWEMQDHAIANTHNIGAKPGYVVSRIGDFNKDGDVDLLFREVGTDALVIWEINSNAYVAEYSLGNTGSGYSPACAGDFDADGDDDIMLFSTATQEKWIIVENHARTGQKFGSTNSGFAFISCGDYDGDGDMDTVWRRTADNLTRVVLQQGVLTTPVKQTVYTNPYGGVDIGTDGYGFVYRGNSN